MVDITSYDLEKLEPTVLYTLYQQAKEEGPVDAIDDIQLEICERWEAGVETEMARDDGHGLGDDIQVRRRGGEDEPTGEDLDGTADDSHEDERTVPDDATEAVVKFFPQVWQDDYALTGDPERFVVPIEDATDEDGFLFEDDSAESDQLRDHENAPKLARTWAGPFYCAITEVR